MFCPKCGGEFRPGFVRCADCDVPLVEVKPSTPPAEDHDVDLVTVLSTSDAALIAVAKSLLDSAEIEYMTVGEGIQDIIGLGRISYDMNVAIGPVEIRVDARDEEEATALLSDLLDGAIEPPAETDGDDEP